MANDKLTSDPVKKQADGGVKLSELSPMDPPDAYAPPALSPVSLAEMHPYLRRFSEEHINFLKEIQTFEDAISSVQKNGFTKESDKILRHFFHFLELDFTAHSRKEEETLFPLLNQRLLADGEHSKSESPTTSVDLMQDDHTKAVQLAAVIVNFMGMAVRLPDERSRLIVLDAAIEQCKNLVELMRLHIFREDNIVFAAAHRLITASEFDRIEANTFLQ